MMKEKYMEILVKWGLQILIVSSIVLVCIIDFYNSYQYKKYWRREVKCTISECQKSRVKNSLFCEEHNCSHLFCRNQRMDGSVYCEQHAYCSYNKVCRKKLSENEDLYCAKHQKFVDQEKAQEEKKRKEEQEAYAARRAAIEESKKNEVRRREHQASKGNGAGVNPYASHDRGYDDVYDGDYNDRRYRTDSQYASGVDEAIDELGDDW